MISRAGCSWRNVARRSNVTTMALRCARVLLLISACAAVLCPRPATAQDTTEIVVLGVAHAGMLVAESYQPAVLRAYIDRVQPDAICVERSPEEFARGSHYEFTYEIQSLVVPYARAQQIPIWSRNRPAEKQKMS